MLKKTLFERCDIAILVFLFFLTICPKRGLLVRHLGTQLAQLKMKDIWSLQLLALFVERHY